MRSTPLTPGTARRAPTPTSTSVLASEAQPGGRRAPHRRNAAAPSRTRGCPVHHCCASPDVYDDPPADLIDAHLAARHQRMCTQRHRTRASGVTSKPDVRRRMDGRQRRARLDRRTRALDVRSSSVSSLPYRSCRMTRRPSILTRSMRPSRRSPTVRNRMPAPNVPNVSTPSHRSTPPRIDARIRGATHSDIERCAPRRRDVGKASVGEWLPLRERIDTPQAAPRCGRRKCGADTRTPGPETPPDGDALAAAGERATRHLHLAPERGNHTKCGEAPSVGRHQRPLGHCRAKLHESRRHGNECELRGRCRGKLAQLTSRAHEALPT